MRILSALLALTMTLSVGAADVDGDGIDTSLVPIVFGPAEVIDGAYGSEWAGEVWLTNSSDQGLRMQHWSCFPPCSNAIDAHQIGIHQFPKKAAVDQGLLYLIPAEVQDQVGLTARMFERSRYAQPNGIDLPVVREDEYLTGPALLLGLPVGPASRATIRIYDPFRTTDLQVRLDFVSEDSDLIASRIVNVIPGEERFWPGYGEITDVFSEVPALGNEKRIHVRVAPLRDNSRYWAFASVTDNDTQHVLIVPPAR